MPSSTNSPAHEPEAGGAGVGAQSGDPPSEPAETLGSIARKLGPLSYLGVFASIVPAVAGIVLLSTLDPVGGWLRSHDEWGAVIYVVAFMLLAGLALLPTYSQAVLGGWAFGFGIGLPLALAGFFGGSLIGYTIAARAGGDRGLRLINEHPKWRAVRNALVGGTEGVGYLRTIGIVALLRVPPNSPFALTNLVMAAAKVPRMPFAIGTLLGMAPRTAVAVYLARLVQGEFSFKAASDAKPWWVLPASIASAVIALGIVGWIASKALKRVTAAHAEGSTEPALAGAAAGEVSNDARGGPAGA